MMKDGMVYGNYLQIQMGIENELTVPHEDNIEMAKDRKDERYAQLLNQCEEAGCSAEQFSSEVGCRGVVGNRMRQWLLLMGFPKCKINKLIKEIQETVEKVSHWIWLKRNDESIA